MPHSDSLPGVIAQLSVQRGIFDASDTKTMDTARQLQGRESFQDSFGLPAIQQAYAGQQTTWGYKPAVLLELNESETFRACCGLWAVIGALASTNRLYLRIIQSFW